MPEVAEPTTATTVAEPSPTFDTSQLDAILSTIPGLGSDDVAPLPAAEPIAPAPATEPTKPAPAPVEIPDDPFSPPPSVLVEAPKVEAPAVDEIESKYGTIPEKPARGFKNNEEEVNWTNVRKSHEELKADLRSMREAAKKVEPNAEASAQIKELTERVTQLNAIVERKALDEHPWVETTFNEPRRQQLAAAEKALQLADVDPSILKKVMALDGKERIQAVDELMGAIDSETIKKKLGHSLDTIEAIDAKKREFFADRQGNVEKMTQAEKAEQFRRMQEEEAKLKSGADMVQEYVTNKLGFEFGKKANEPGSEKWNERVEKDNALYYDIIMQNKDPMRLMTAVAMGVQAPHFRTAWQSERSKRLAAEARVAELEGTLPTIAGGRNDSAVSTGNADKDFDAAGITSEDDLGTMARKLGRVLSSRQ